MIDRRSLLAGHAAGAAGATALSARPQVARAATPWAAKYPELVLAVVPAENASGVSDRFAPFTAYLSRELGTKVTLRIANDYAAVIEGQRAGNVHIGYYGPASFARARLTGVKTDAFVIDVNSDGTKGYYSVFYVLAKSPYHTIADLKGQNIGLVDPNSTSGYNMPLYALNKRGINAEKFFKNEQITGSHENAVLALVQGTVQKNPDGSPMKKDDFRIILKSDLIINSPTAYLTALPTNLKAAIKQAYLEAPTKDKAAFDKLSDGKNQPWQPVDNAAYDDTIKLIKFVDGLRKRA
jgi:phosphonate transport system substrate-binding protein